MKLKHLLLAAAASATILSAPVHAEDEGWYVSVQGGANHLHDGDAEGLNFNQEIDYDWGYAAQGAVGYHYDNGLRSEVEIGFRKNDVDSVATGTASGDINAYSAMFNMLYDFDISETGLDTYIGAGGGIVHVDYDNVSPVGGQIVDDSDTTAAFQAIAGVSYDVGEATELFANYKYFRAIDPKLRNQASAGTDIDYEASTITMGLKFNLFDSNKNAGPAREISSAPAFAGENKVASYQAKPAAEPISRTYIVFFDLNKHGISRDAMEILKRAAMDASKGNAVGIQVVGHADTSGSKSYNMDLSKRRALNVQKALSAMGIQPNNVRTMARGETDLLVPTSDGTREPQNRRVEINYVISPR